MDIKTVEEEGRLGIELIIVSAPGDIRVPRLIEKLRACDARITGYLPDGTAGRQVIPIDKVIFVETFEKRAYIHTKDDVLESPMRLFELEEALEGTEFVRASRQVLLNFDHVAAIRPELNGRLVLEMDDGRSLLASRNYANDIKMKIKIGAAR